MIKLKTNSKNKKIGGKKGLDAYGLKKRPWSTGLG